MANAEKEQVGVASGHDGRMPDHDPGMERTRTNIDVIQTTRENPYKELNFIGTYIAIAIGCAAAFASYIMPVTAIGEINAIIGPSPSYVWVPLAWVLMSSVGFTLVGRLSDIFGRRYFFAGCSAFGTIGCIIGCTANGINQLIAASAFLGLAAAGQISFNYVLGELVPIRHRFAANGIIFVVGFPFSGMGPYLARLFIERTASGWRGIYYSSLALHATATICWLVFYHPPKFENLHRDRTKTQEIREMDFGGIILFTGGLILFLVGLSWGGTVYPWGSGHTLGTLITGILVLIIFVLYEIFMPLQRPLIPMHLFRNYDYDIANVLSIVGGMVYYSASVLFPTMVAALYTTDVVEGGLVSCAVGGGVCAGQAIGSVIAVPGGKLRFKLIFISAGLCAFTAGLAGATNSQAIGSALATCAGLCIGMLEVIISTVVTIVLDDQSEIGTGAGVFGSLRGAGGVIATAIYATILANKLTENITNNVVPALLGAGLPPASVEPYLTAVQAGDVQALKIVPGISAQIIQVGTAAIFGAYENAFRITWLATLGFGVLCFLCACGARDIDDKLTHDVIRRLGVGFGGTKEKPAYNSEKVTDAEHIDSAA